MFNAEILVRDYGFSSQFFQTCCECEKFPNSISGRMPSKAKYAIQLILIVLSLVFKATRQQMVMNAHLS